MIKFLTKKEINIFIFFEILYFKFQRFHISKNRIISKYFRLKIKRLKFHSLSIHTFDETQSQVVDVQNGDSIRDIGPQCAGQEHTNQCYEPSSYLDISAATTCTKSKTIDEEANNPCCLTLYDMACKMAGVVDPLNIQEVASPVPFTILIYHNSSDCFY